MASSFSSQIPAIVYLLKQLKPKSVLDIGKGFGKYGFLIHEYVGIDKQKKINPLLSLSQQSNIMIDAVEADEDLMLPHLSQIYSTIYFGDVFEIYKDLRSYDLILMIDVIEHLNKENALDMLRSFLEQKSLILIASPVKFFKQKLYLSEYELHVSHWILNDFKKLGFVKHQYVDAGAIYLLSNQKLEISGFGNSLLNKARRIMRLLRNEIHL